MIRYVYLGSYDDVKHFFFILTKFVNVCPRIDQKHNHRFFKNLSYQKEQDFWYYKMGSPKWDLPTLDIKMP